MSMIKLLGKIAIGIAAATAVISALPILGAVGAVSVTGAAIAAIVGTVAAIIDENNKGKIKQ